MEKMNQKSSPFQEDLQKWALIAYEPRKYLPWITVILFVSDRESMVSTASCWDLLRLRRSLLSPGLGDAEVVSARPTVHSGGHTRSSMSPDSFAGLGNHMFCIHGLSVSNCKLPCRIRRTVAARWASAVVGSSRPIDLTVRIVFVLSNGRAISRLVVLPSTPPVWPCKVYVPPRAFWTEIEMVWECLLVTGMEEEQGLLAWEGRRWSLYAADFKFRPSKLCAVVNPCFVWSGLICVRRSESCVILARMSSVFKQGRNERSE